MDIYQRTKLVIGEEGLNRLAGAHVVIAGLGGVGSAAAEALARSAVGALTLIDKDTVEPSNLNRQLLATVKTLGRPKAQVMAERVNDIAPGCKPIPKIMFITRENVAEMLTPPPDYVLDAVDNVTAKLAMAEYCSRAGIPIISCMATGNKLDPARFEVADISQTSVCPLCRVMRKELRARGIPSLRVVYSTEQPGKGDGRTPGSISFVPPVAGMIAAGAIVRSLIQSDANAHDD